MLYFNTNVGATLMIFPFREVTPMGTFEDLVWTEGLKLHYDIF